MKFSKMNCDISEPLLLNCWKHHAGFIRSKIGEYKTNPADHLSSLRSELLLIGESLMDLYLGELTPYEIGALIIAYCIKQKIFSKEEFQFWLKDEGNDYRIIELKDKSKWTLRLGNDKERYMHIHPSRYSPHTIRVRSSSLKSAILYLVLENQNPQNMLLPVNCIRKYYLNLPPLKNLASCSALYTLIETLS
jgi:hypothetical protein